MTNDTLGLSLRHSRKIVDARMAQNPKINKSSTYRISITKRMRNWYQTAQEKTHKHTSDKPRQIKREITGRRVKNFKTKETSSLQKAGDNRAT